ncbi:DUF3300 domain-containing protein [Rhizobium chutanense]|uniref:DUF3300 domain-containing protein n=2 Tax=Rhizobium chutanense TaxID=2035448 RepID=A0A432NDM0_9HYPH|nr:DUF3300 domain-containing protein [Rhizobium chutanense]
MMKARYFRLLAGFSAITISSLPPVPWTYAQTAAPATKAEPVQAPAAEAAGLSDDELEVLVARIALYPDDLVAAISAASLFPLQVVEAARFLEAKKKNASLQPKSEWDGSVISLLNYPEVVKMMSDDLEWTQSLGDALTNQQKDVLIAIQQLRDEAIAKNIIKTDDKVTIVNEGDNVIIQPTNPEKVYIPQYAPEMLYEPNYDIAPISYYPDSYDNYYYPGAGFFAAAVTGVAWAAIVNWDDWGVWGGRWNGDVDIDCNDCFNNRNFNGKMNLNDVDWKNVDRSKLSIGKDQLNKLDRSAIRSNLQTDSRNQLKNQAGNLQRERNQSRGDVGARAADVRKNTAQGLKSNPKTSVGDTARRANAPRADTRPANAGNRQAQAAPKAKPKSSKPKMAAKADNRSRQQSALGNVQSGRREVVNSQRGGQSMGGGQRGAPRATQHRSRPPVSHGGGGRGGGRGGGGRGGGGRR